VGTKLTGAMLLVLAGVTVVAFLGSSRSEREKLLSAKERAATMVTELFSAGLTAPLSFNDDSGVREHIELLMRSTNVGYAAVWAAHGSLRRGEKIAETARDIRAPAVSATLPLALEVQRHPNTVRIQKPVVSDSGEVLGAVLLEWSLLAENAEIAAERSRTLLTFLASALGLAVVVLALSQTLVVRRLRQLTRAAKRLEEGEAVEIRSETNDEVGALSRAFSSMSEAIAAREAEISQRIRDLKRVLDNIAEGLLSVKKSGLLCGERSRAIDAWFGAPGPGVELHEYFQSIAPATADLLRLGWTALNDALMPIEVVLDQMRTRFEHEQRSYELDFCPIWLGADESQIIDEVLVVIRDVTAVVERERAEQAQREALQVFRRILADPGALREFLRNGSRLVEAIEQARGSLPTSSVRRAIHTLKGDTALYGIESVATLCHRIESDLQDSAGPVGAENVAALRAAWDRVLALAVELESGAGKDRIELQVDEYEEHLARLEACHCDHALIASVRAWIHEPAQRSLLRLAEQSRTLARKIGKADTAIAVQVVPATLRLPLARWAPIWAVFSHVLRNTLDHGIETGTERQAAHKSPHGTVEIKLTLSHDIVALSVADDGRGIDWEKVRARARRVGLLHGTRAELEEALYADHVTTKEEVSEVSGRGIGMGTVREVVRNCGGEMTLHSQAGVGTTVTCSFPLEMIDAPRHAA
jgi:two-component system chemotaxis sensor kinase CheA